MKNSCLLLISWISFSFSIPAPVVHSHETVKVATGKEEKLFLKHVDECLDMIASAAKDIPMTGVAMVAFIPGEQSSTWISKMKVAGKLADDKANLLGIVYTKASEMAVTLQNSGNPGRKEIRGEFGYIGGVIEKVQGGYLLAAFSGGKGEDDVAVAKKGLLWLAEKFK